MRWPVVRLIAGKELRDLIRDRRTVMLVLVLPVILYPLFGAVGCLFVFSLLRQPAVVGVVGAEHLPGDGPTLFDGDHFAPGLDDPDDDRVPVTVKRLTGDPVEILQSRQADALLVVPPNFAADLAAPNKKPGLAIRYREGDDKAKLAGRRVASAVRAWEGKVREKRFEKQGLPKDFDKVLAVDDQQEAKPKAKRAADELRDTFGRVFPFILMMWLVAGAIQPAVDMTAGEKERGTMETLLISPAERSEIVVGKFLAVTAFSFTAVVWNVAWLATGGFLLEAVFGFPIINPAGLLWCVVLGLPQAMLFSAVSLALGVFARSTKEGQYYLMPLMLLSMPLAFWSMMPGAELGPGTCWVPVTGAMLLQQRLLAVSGEPVPWEYVAPVLGALAVWVALALAVAVRQFKRESVLFREAGPEKGGPLALFRRGR